MDLNKAVRGRFNLISSGCGTGKSYFVLHDLLEHYPDVKPEEIIVVTSRSLTIDQQTKDDGVTKLCAGDKEIVNFWNNDDRGIDINVVQDGNIRIMTYDRFINLLDYCNDPEGPTFSNVKIAVFDECHSMLSDKYVDGMIAVRRWINERIHQKDKLVFGLTATPNILFVNQRRMGFWINQLNDGVFIKHKAKQLICANFPSLPHIVNKLPGKTLIMCNSLKQCRTLESKIPNSFVMVSTSNKEFTPIMQCVRNYMTKTATLPDCYTVDGETHKLNVLIATCTVREGFNLIESSGVKNIVSCLPDDIHTIQIAGRARYDLENLVVVACPPGMDDKQHPDDYMPAQRWMFRRFMNGEENGRKWFDMIASVVQHGFEDTIIYGKKTDLDNYKAWIDEKWTTGEGQADKRLYRKEDRNEFVQKCLEFKVTDRKPSVLTFNYIMNLLPDWGYEVETGRAMLDGKKVIYKVIRPAG